jgi:hypothetical protein
MSPSGGALRRLASGPRHPPSGGRRELGPGEAYDSVLTFGRGRCWWFPGFPGTASGSVARFAYHLFGGETRVAKAPPLGGLANGVIAAKKNDRTALRGPRLVRFALRSREGALARKRRFAGRRRVQVGRYEVGRGPGHTLKTGPRSREEALKENLLWCKRVAETPRRRASADVMGGAVNQLAATAPLSILWRPGRRQERTALRR